MADSKTYQELESDFVHLATTTGLIHDTSGKREQINQIASKQELLIKDSKGNDLLVPIRIPQNSEHVIIDAVNFVCGIESFDDGYSEIFNSKELTHEEKEPHALEFAYHITAELANMLGSEFADCTYNCKGMHFYKWAFTIGDRDNILGSIMFGGQNNTVLIMISGTGCQYADNYWEYNLYNWLKYDAQRAKLSRVDLAHDDFEGRYSSPEIADEADSQGMFALTNRLPSVQKLGDWKRHEGKGRTLQIGRRENGKLYRGYEKGKKFGDKESPWFRSEVEFGNKGRLLPFDMLIHPTQYFAGAYPFCLELIETSSNEIFVAVERIECVKKESEISLEKSLQIWKTQAGRYLRAYRDIYKKQDKFGRIVSDDSHIIDLLVTDNEDYYPPRLKVIEKFVFKPPTYAPWSSERALIKAESIPY